MVEEKKEVTVKADIQLPSTDWKKEIKLVKEITAKGCDETEFKLLCYMSKLYGLNPLRKEIWAIKFVNKPAIIMVSRDGLRHIAQKSGQLGCIKTTCKLEEKDTASKVRYVGAPVKPISATCQIWRKDYPKAFEATCFFDEYNRNMALWRTHPKQMLSKCAEASCLRMAFDVSGLYIPEEMPSANGQEVKEESKDEDETV